MSYPPRTNHPLLPLVLLTLLVQACTAVKPAPGDAESLHQRIRSGIAVKTGERVRVTTHDGLAVLLTVTAITRDNLSGNQAVFLPANITWGESWNLEADPDKSTVISIPVDSIDSIVDEQAHESTKPTHAGKALLLAVYGFLLVLAWTIP